MVGSIGDSAVERAMARAAQNRVTMAIDTDMERILRLPSEPPDEAAWAVDAERWTRALRLHEDAPPLRPVQGAFLSSLFRAACSETPRGVFAPIPVGGGKTLSTLLAPTVIGAERALLLIPPSMREQLQRDVAEWRRHYRFEPPKIMAYSELSQATATSFLEYYQPDLVIADEAHSIRAKSSARSKRLFRYLRDNPACRVALLSGTITGKSLLDHAHMLEASLRDWTPLPLHQKTLEQWASVIDPDGEPDHNSLTALWSLVQTYDPGAPADFSRLTPGDRQKRARLAYQQRFLSVPGVVSTRHASTGASLYLVRRSLSVPPVIHDALKTLETTMSLPDPDGVASEHGEELVDGASVARAASNLSAGFFYRWDWSWHGRRQKSDDDREWMRRRAQWHKAVRDTLKMQSRAGLDSPLLVARHAALGKGGSDLQHAYHEWHESRSGDDVGGRSVKTDQGRWCDRAPPPVLPVWLSEFLIDDVFRFVADERRLVKGTDGGHGGKVILWYQSRAVEELLKARGLPVYGAGTDSPANSSGVVACSISVHGKGKNLQAWSRNLVIEPPSSGTVWEQLLGRTHRQGQMADEVYAFVYQHTQRTQVAVKKATDEAKYIQQTQGVPQKLVYGTWTTASALKEK